MEKEDFYCLQSIENFFLILDEHRLKGLEENI